MAHDMGRLVRHRHYPGGVTQGAAVGKNRVLGDQGLQHRLVAMQDRPHPGMALHANGKTGNDSCRSAIATHGVNRNDDFAGERGRR